MATLAPMADRSRTRLLGRYATPRFRYGDVAMDDVRGGFPDATPRSAPSRVFGAADW